MTFQSFPFGLKTGFDVNYVQTTHHLKPFFDDLDVQAKVSNHVSCKLQFNIPAGPTRCWVVKHREHHSTSFTYPGRTDDLNY